jgi:hypothetical protein
MFKEPGRVGDILLVSFNDVEGVSSVPKENSNPSAPGMEQT